MHMLFSQRNFIHNLIMALSRATFGAREIDTIISANCNLPPKNLHDSIQGELFCEMYS